MDITRVQRWVASALTLTVAYVWAGGLVLGALFTMEDDRHTAKVMILVLAGTIGMVAVIGVRLINKLPLLTPWLLVGLIPTAAGLWGLSVR